MPRIEEVVEIAVNRADVFKFCHDIERRPVWDEQVEKIELLTPRPVRSGTLLRVDSKGGAIFSWDAEVISFQFPSGSSLRVLDVASSSPFARGSELSWEFEAVGTRTRFKWVWDYRPNGFIARIIDALGRRAATQRAIRRSMENLKKIIESGQRAGWKH
ncbi:MAG: SRPBCC family protein [Anaerolineae bacterium]|nr:SRPBCC family protein [Anaerolineae bacterium]